MDIAAQQVQRHVQGVADHGDQEEQNDIAGDGAEGVEHLGNDRTGQHQRHQTGIGQNIGKISGNVIVQGTADAHELSADTLLAIALGEYQKDDDGDDKGFYLAGERCTAAQNKHQVPCAFIAKGVHHLTAAHLVVNVHGHTGEDLNETQHQRAQ